MLCRDYLIILQEFTNRLTLKQNQERAVNPGCGCKHPGTELKCEDCPFLEACLSRSKTLKTLHSNSKVKVSA